MITRPQVEHFLTAQIGFHDWESVLGENKEEFLFKLVHYAQKTLYYEVSSNDKNILKSQPQQSGRKQL